jgi:ATP/maltotriose-dependent transcriptional regulator MalT
MVLTLLMQGASNESIIKRMFMSESSVKKHLTNIYRKLTVKNRTQAVMKGLKENDITYKKQIGKL